MAGCNEKLSKSFVRSCSYKPKAGLDSTVFVVNTEDIDKSATQTSNGGAKITNLVLKEDAKVYKFEGAGKFPQGKVALKKGDNGNGWTHSLSVRVLYYGVEEREELNKLIRDGRITAIVKKKDGGVNGELTYSVLGYESGMAIQSSEWSSADNDGVKPVDFATEEGEEEALDDRVLVHTDLSGTENFLTSNLAS